jgi:hypothetical protein
MKLLPALALAFTTILIPLQAADPAPAPAGAVVHVDCTKLFNARVVATFTDGKVVPVGIDLDGAGGVATKAVATFLKNDPNTCVPDDGKFPAADGRPEFQLHFSNADGTGNQVLRMPDKHDFSFDVPAKHYSQMYLFFTSGAAGPAPMKVTMTYQDGSTEDRDIVCPDWWELLTEKNNPKKDIFYVGWNLAKYGVNNTKVLEKDHHYIFAIDIHPTPAKTLTAIKVQKTKPRVCFWGATGVAAAGQ